MYNSIKGCTIIVILNIIKEASVSILMGLLASMYFLLSVLY